MKSNDKDIEFDKNSSKASSAPSVESVNPYSNDSRSKGQQVKEMFDSIAPAYDFMNRAMTLGIDRRWRKIAVSMIKKHCGDVAQPAILDVATGTGDLAMQMARAIPTATVTGIDLSEGMVALGRKKVEEAGLADRVALGIGDSLALPYHDDSFDCVSVAFGVRNFERLADGYREMLRVLKPGGLLCVIELSTPTSTIVKPLYKLYTRKIIPFVGKIVSKDSDAYSYLPASIEAVVQGAEMTSLIQSVGFTSATHRPLTFGVCTIYSAKK